MSIFRFKQFSIDQTGCAMKVNTDGVLLGALADAKHAESILDIGTGTGVIALMLAQRFATAQIDAVELDETAAQTALNNFQNSPFNSRLQIHTQSFQYYFKLHSDKKYDFIVSNPPFYIQSLQSPQAGKNMAKHADSDFFEQLIKFCAQQLLPCGKVWLILPLSTSALVKQLAIAQRLCVQQTISILSYPQSAPHRQILVLGFHQTETEEQRLIIYSEPKIYTDTYRSVLKDFLTIF
ncbi:tRNA1(Val) (adenine(37)-N6)-methyltransferase [Mucilaginibacter terrae]|uniref:tRNA1(Val) (adenine(37)-N6)-methyltransferase n=1 Tax=Mucilaginibacter terrae TaxID=1955052 RepID=UPI0036254001